MGSEKETLKALENLLDEFFNGNTTNERKRAIEEVLDNFSHQEGAWRQCIYFLSSSSNHYVHMYSLSIFEKLVNQRWFGMPSDSKQEIRKFCTQFLMLPNTQCPVFIKKKMAKVYVDIGRLDWPQFFPDFYHNMLQFFRNDSTITLGLTLLQMTSEEFISPREDLNNARKQELRSLLLEQAARTLEQITHLLDSIIQKLKLQTNTVTPPSSPRQQSPFSSPRRSPTPTSSASPFLSISNISTSNTFLNQNFTKQELGGFLPNLDASTEEIVLAALSCIHQFFSWIPLQNLVSSSLVGKLFMFAGYGYTGSTNGNADQKANQIGTLAMGCINEIMSKNYFPTECGEFLMKIFQQTFNLIQQLTKSNSDQLGNGTLARLDENYLEKFTEFLSLFVGIHLKRFEPERNFPTGELLSLLVKYTILQPTVQGFFNCLDIWMTFLDYLCSKIKTSKNSNGMRENDYKKYSEALMDLLGKLLCKIQLRYNETQLEELDDDDEDNSSENANESERAKFVRECLEVIARIAEIDPDDVVMKVVEVLQSNLDIYFGLASHISDHSSPGRRLQLSNNEELQSLHVCLRDLSTFLQTVGRLAHLFVGDENFNRKLADGLVIFERLCQMVMFGTYYKLYSIKNAKPEPLTKDFINVQAHGLACLQAFCHWLELFHLESKRKNESAEKFGSIIISILEGSLPLLQSTIPHRILIAASHLILSLNTTVRPQSFLTLDIVQKFYGTMAAGGLEALPLSIQVIVGCSLSNAFALPWPLVPQEAQEWEMRSSHHKCLINSFTREYQHLPEIRVLSSNLEERNRCKDYVKRICRILSGVVDAVADQGTKSKTIVHQSTHEAIQIAANLLPVYLAHTDVAEEILGLLLVTIKSLKIQVGVTFVQHVIQQLLTLLTREQIAKIVEQNSENGYRVLEKFLKMLEFIVQEHDSSFKALVPAIIEFNLHQTLPVLEKYPAAEIKTTIIELLHQLLIHNWRFFFKSDVISKMAGEDCLQNEELFISIIKEIGQSLMDTDITLFKKSLEILQSLNERYKLYSKAVFQSKMLSTFLHVLLNSLVSQSHDLLKEDIIITIHSMASIDLSKFNNEFMQHYLMQSEGLTDHQKTELLKTFQNKEDIPSFVAALQQFFGDYRYYRLINSSLPNGPLHL